MERSFKNAVLNSCGNKSGLSQKTFTVAVESRPENTRVAGEGQTQGDLKVQAPLVEGQKTGKKKKLPTAERKRRREEEQLKRLYGPKDSHIQLISLNVLQKLNDTNCNSSRKPPEKVNVFSKDEFPSFASVTEAPRRVEKPLDTEEDFPALVSAVSSKAASIKSATSSSKEMSQSKDEEEPDEDGWETENENDPKEKDGNPKDVVGSGSKIIEKMTSSPEIAKSSQTPSSGKKSKNPLVISLDALIKVNKTEAAKKRREAKKAKIFKKGTTTGLEKNTLGNILDSSGPMLIKRGKMREKPRKKKVTALKKAILITRALRASQATNKVKGESSTTEGSKKKRKKSGLKKIIVDGNTKTTDSGSITPSEELVSPPSESCQPALNSEEQSTKDQNGTSSGAPNIFATLLESAERSQQELLPVMIDTKELNNKDVGPDIILQAKQSIHSRKFRPYCNMYVSKELHGHLMVLMKELHRFQDRIYHTDPIRFQSKRRYVHGLKDTINYLEINKVAMVILAPDMESNDVKGGLDEKISTIMHKTSANNIPLIFSGNRFILGKLIFIKSQVSAIAILDKQGAEELFRTVVLEASKLREKYLIDLEEKIQQVLNASVVEAS